jgi:hypothetical protein
MAPDLKLVPNNAPPAFSAEIENLLAEWTAASEVAKKAAADIAEYSAKYAPIFELVSLLKAKITEAFFPGCPEGTTNYPLPNGYKLKHELKFYRKLDAEALESIRDPLAKTGVSLDLLIRKKPELELKAYRMLTAEQRRVFDAVLTTTPAKPEITLVAPKAKAAK